MRNVYLAIVIFIVEIMLQEFWIRLQQTGIIKIFQKQKSYGPAIVEKKASTPSMGGIVFIVISASLCVTRSADYKIWLFAIACGFIGLIDDGIKSFQGSSEGFSSLRKITLQVFLSLIYAFLICREYDIYLWRNVISPVWVSFPLIVFLSVGLQNAVNVTDGLDGLATGGVAISLIATAIYMGELNFDFAIAIGMVIGFLWHNSHPAHVFMGDAGSHFLAGLLFALILFNGSILLIVPFTFLFGIEIISVAIQIFSIRIFGRRIFRMAPLHHHFQRLNREVDYIVPSSDLEETIIVNRFYIVHIFGMALLYVILWRVL
ncbi:MAG: phospho-N-acetylmuramoyl-pentapeptide-transferase [Synergistaceae bacterium]|nr:phospho-N-acetylmuramoyl-pentapeptide-transferase [Synergistaceae bacterium]